MRHYRRRTSSTHANPWKRATLGLLGLIGAGLATEAVVAHYTGTNQSPAPAGSGAPPPADQPLTSGPPPRPPAPAAPPAPNGVNHPPRAPSLADIEACNRYARSLKRDRTQQTLESALMGGAVGAGLGAAGGAIAGGGSGAGKGAGIGGLLGAAAGTVYGLDKSNQQDGVSAAAYRACMKRHGYVE